MHVLCVMPVPKFGSHFIDIMLPRKPAMHSIKTAGTYQTFICYVFALLELVIYS